MREEPPSNTPKPREPRDHLFLAIFPDVNTAARIAQLASRLRVAHGLGHRQLATNRFHMTLYSLGMHVGVSEILVRAASEAAAAIVTVIPPFKVIFDRALSFAGRPGNRPFVLRGRSDNTALVEFRRRLGSALDNYGVPHSPHLAFTPHLTLLYSEQSAAEESIETVSWMVNEFVLVHSLVGKTIHNHLASWTLQG